MLTGQKLEQHYNSLSTNDLHIIREEYMWVLNTCGVHNDEQIKYIEKALTQRGEAISGHQNKKTPVSVQMRAKPCRHYQHTRR